MAEFIEHFESGLGAWTTNGVIATSTDQACDYANSLKVTTSATDGPYIRSAAFASAGVYDRWQYVSFSLFIADFADFWQGGANLDPNICGWARLDNGSEIPQSPMWIESTSNSAAKLQDNNGDLGNLVEGSWNSVVYGINFNTVLTNTQKQVWINGSTTGLIVGGGLPGSPGAYFQLGDRGETWGAFTQATYYVDKFTYQPDWRLPDVICFNEPQPARSAKSGPTGW